MYLKNRVTDVENKVMVSMGGKGTGINWEIETDMYV